ncbi:MAG: UvrD-helicase domain-containing protein [Patescibacteria group bacterium]
MDMNLNKEQKSASEAPNFPLLIVAGAGTGKTRTLTARVVKFIEDGMPPERICAITFTNKAAKEMAERVDAAVKSYKGAARPLVCTFHSLGARILRKEGKKMGREPNFVIFDGHDSFDLIRKIIKKSTIREEWSGDRGGETKNAKKPAFFANIISEIKNVDSAPQRLLASKREEEKLALKVFKDYESALKRNNAFDFDDLIEKTVRLFREHPAVLKKYQNKFDAILVDEYQDINPKQYELIKLLSEDHGNISVVGDDEQMIYGWRHADLKIFFAFERDWPKAQISFLEENYRSSGNIIEAASAVAKNNRYRHPKDLWTKNPEGAPIKIAEFADENDEAEWIAAQIESRIKNSESKAPSTAILYRTNAQSRALEQALIMREIPYRIFGGIKFYERREIKDIVAAIRYASNKKDELSLERLRKNLTKGKFSRLEEKILGANAETMNPTNLIETFLKTTGYAEYLERNFLNHEERRENITELIHFASRFNDVREFLEEVALVQSTDNESSSGQGGRLALKNQGFIDLMTIHLAKGLEFDKVFLAGCGEGLLPHSRSLDNEYQLEEERRLMYVAMTRARKELVLSFYDMPSRFLGEIPEKFTEFEDVSGRENTDAWSENSVHLD